jgi:hypothetical protein
MVDVSSSATSGEQPVQKGHRGKGIGEQEPTKRTKEAIGKHLSSSFPLFPPVQHLSWPIVQSSWRRRSLCALAPWRETCQEF